MFKRPVLGEINHRLVASKYSCACALDTSFLNCQPEQRLTYNVTDTSVWDRQDLVFQFFLGHNIDEVASIS